jgi:hypothetical protein
MIKKKFITDWYISDSGYCTQRLCLRNISAANFCTDANCPAWDYLSLTQTLNTNPGIIFQSGHDHVLPNSLQIIIHPPPPPVASYGTQYRHLSDNNTNQTTWIHTWYGGPGSSVGLATGYVLDNPGIESRWEARFSSHVQTGHGAHPASCTMGTGSFPGVKCGQDVTLTLHPF